MDGRAPLSFFRRTQAIYTISQYTCVIAVELFSLRRDVQISDLSIPVAMCSTSRNISRRRRIPKDCLAPASRRANGTGVVARRLGFVWHTVTDQLCRTKIFHKKRSNHGFHCMNVLEPASGVRVALVIRAVISWLIATAPTNPDRN